MDGGANGNPNGMKLGGGPNMGGERLLSLGEHGIMRPFDDVYGWFHQLYSV